MKYCVRCGCGLYPDMVHWVEIETRPGFTLGTVGPLCLICLQLVGDSVLDRCRGGAREEMPVHLL